MRSALSQAAMPVAVVCQGLDYPAFSDPATGAFLEHPLQFRSQGAEAGNAVLDFSEAR